MLQTILHSTLRQARRHPLYVGLNVFGLALGLCVFLLLAQYVRYEYAYNRTIPHADLVARVDDTATYPGRAPVEDGTLSFRALPFLREDFPTLVAATLDRPTRVMLQAQGTRLMQSIDQVDGDYLKTIPLRLAAGDPRTALDRPDAIVLSARVARALFGTAPALGRTLLIDAFGDKSNVTVTGILAAPDGPVSLDPGALMIIPAKVRAENEAFASWAATGGALYVRFRSRADMRQAERGLFDFMTRRGDPRALGPSPEKTNLLSFAPLAGLRFHDKTVTNATNGADRAIVDGLGLVGVLALALAIANAINLATARGAMRAREAAMRKTLGASRLHLFVQFVGESLLLTAIAGLVALSLRELLLPLVSAMTATALPGNDPMTVGILIVAVCVTGFASGLYPALVLSAQRPAAVLAASRMPAGGRGAARLRTALVGGQFTLAALIAICTLIIHRQVAFVSNSDPGYDKQGILIGPNPPANNAGERRRLLDALRAVPGVQAATLSVLEPDLQLRNDIDVQQPDGRRLRLLTDVVTDQYREVYRPRLLAGRWFDPSHGRDASRGTGNLGDVAGSYNVVINARAATALGFATPQAAIGQHLQMGRTQFEIIGVVQDIRFISPHQPVAPLIVFYAPTKEGFSIPSVRYAGVTAQVMQDRLRKVWDGLMPDVEGNFQRAEDRTASFYDADRRQALLFLSGSIAAIFIACLGLFGLAAFAGARRRQEVGIRKTLGANTAQIVVLMLREFLTPVLVACAIACPLAWGTMRSWLERFAQRIPLGPADFLVVIGGAVAIATLTVAGQTWRVARTTPAHALRAE